MPHPFNHSHLTSTLTSNCQAKKGLNVKSPSFVSFCATSFRPESFWPSYKWLTRTIWAYTEDCWGLQQQIKHSDLVSLHNWTGLPCSRHRLHRNTDYLCIILKNIFQIWSLYESIDRWLSLTLAFNLVTYEFFMLGPHHLSWTKKGLAKHTSDKNLTWIWVLESQWMRLLGA